MIIQYGVSDRYIDVTYLFKDSSRIYIPANDIGRSILFKNDPYPNVVKHIVFTDDYGIQTKLEHNKFAIIKKDSNNKYILTDEVPSFTELSPTEKLSILHSKLSITHGSFSEEYPEQVMAATYITPENRVLELGGNIGRNSLVIAALLNNSQHLTVLECDPNSAKILTHNRDINNLKFNIITAALSKTPIILRGWDSMPHDGTSPIPAGWTAVPTITWSELSSKIELPFDVLVADCEGALYYILKEEPEFLKTFNTVVVENDYHNIEHKIFVDDVFTKSGLRVVYRQAGGWGPCQDRFFEVWQKVSN
jgi:FkbM family methyltransferase